MQITSVAGAIILGVFAGAIALEVLPAVLSAFFDTITRIAAAYPGLTLTALGALGIYYLVRVYVKR